MRVGGGGARRQFREFRMDENPEKIFQTLLHISVDTPKCYRKTVLPVEFFLSTTSNLLDNRHTNDTMN